MKVKNTRLKDYMGEPIQSPSTKGTLDLKEVLLMAINHREDSEELKPLDSVEIYKASMTLMESDEELELSIEMLSRAKQALPKVFSPMVAGQVISYLDELKTD